MTYYPTLAEDLARAKEILEKGKGERIPCGADQRSAVVTSGTIYGADTHAAYKLLESFVAIIEAGKIEKLEDAATALGQQWKEAAAERDRLRADVETLREYARRRDEEKTRQFMALQEIRQLCDRVLEINGDAREPGALGAVRALVGRYKALVDAVRLAE